MARAPDEPVVSDAIIKALEFNYPDKLPDGTPDIRLVDQMIGAQKVIKLLRRWRDKSTKL